MSLSIEFWLGRIFSPHAVIASGRMVAFLGASVVLGGSVQAQPAGSLPGAFFQVCDGWKRETHGADQNACRDQHSSRVEKTNELFQACWANALRIQTQSLRPAAQAQCQQHQGYCFEVTQRLAVECQQRLRVSGTPTPAPSATPTPPTSTPTMGASGGTNGSSGSSTCDEAKQRRTQDEAVCLSRFTGERTKCDDATTVETRRTCRAQVQTVFDECLSNAERRARATCEAARRNAQLQEAANRRDWAKLFEAPCEPIRRELDDRKFRYCDVDEQVCRKRCDPTELLQCNAKCVESAINCKVALDDYAFDRCAFVRGQGPDPGAWVFPSARNCSEVVGAAKEGRLYDECQTQCPGSSNTVRGWSTCFECLAECRSVVPSNTPAAPPTPSPTDAPCVCPNPPISCGGGVTLQCRVQNGRCTYTPPSCPTSGTR